MNTQTKLSYQEFKNNLSNFYGTEHYYPMGLIRIYLTDGVKYFADTCECYWLMQEICLGLYKLHQQLGTLFINIEVNKNHTVIIRAEQDEGMPVVFQKKIKDLCKLIPVGEYRLYLMNNVLLLPSEY